MAAWVNGETGQLLANFAGEWVKQLDAVNFIVEQVNANRKFRMFGRVYVDRVASNTESTPCEIQVVALVLHGDQALQNIALIELVAVADAQNHGVVIRWISDTIDAAYGAYNDGIAAFQQAFCG